jgi:hypothetical protein
MKVLILAALFLASACSPLYKENMTQLMQRDGSGCFLLGGGAGGGGIGPVVGVPLGGGYGYAWGGHADKGHEVIINAEGCTIKALP